MSDKNATNTSESKAANTRAFFEACMVFLSNLGAPTSEVERPLSSGTYAQDDASSSYKGPLLATTTTTKRR